MAKEHTCHAEGCKIPVNPEKLMCQKHWAMVPSMLQKEVMNHYRPGQCVDKRPSREFIIAAKNAREWVADAESGGGKHV